MAEGRKRARIFCSHCSERVSKSTYYRHMHRSDEAASFLASSSAPARSRSAEDLDTQSSSDSEADQTFNISPPDTRMDNECLSGGECKYLASISVESVYTIFDFSLQIAETVEAVGCQLVNVSVSELMNIHTRAPPVRLWRY